MTLPSTIDLEVGVSWSGTGAFDGDYDDVTDDVDTDDGVSLAMWRESGVQLSPSRIADGGFTLHNGDGFYSQDRADSGVYQRVTPGKPVRYRAGHGERRLYRSHIPYRSHVYYRGRGVWPLGRHLIRDLDPDLEIGDEQVRVTTLGYENALTRTKVTIPVMATPLVSECFTAYLDAVNWPTDKRRIATSDTRLLWYWADERYPWDGFLELLGAEGPGAFGVDRDGTFYFENRNYRSTEARSTTSQATFWDRQDGERTRYRSHTLYRSHRLYRGRTGTLWYTRFKPSDPYKNIYNRATYPTRRRTMGSLASIWSLGADLALGSGQSRTLIVKPNDPFLNAVTPALTTDYTVAGGTVSVTLSASSGLVAFVTVTATGGTPTVSGLQLRAQPLTVVGETIVENSVDASASIAAFSPVPGEDIPLSYDVQGWSEIDVPNAEGVCNAWVLRQQVPRPQGVMTLRNGGGDLVEQIFRRRHSDRLTLVHATSGISADFWINSGRLWIGGAGGRTVILDLGVERCDDIAGAIWDQSEWNDVFAVWGV